MTTVIRTQGLQKHFGRTIALDGLDFSVEAGEIHGFLGPNGAGKSTTIRILLGLARATGGEATLFGRDPWTDAADLHRRVAYVPGDVALWPNFTGGEAIDLLTRLRGGMTDKTAYRERKQRLLDVFQLDPRKKGRAYSKGNRQKVALVAAFATPAELYVLDEPTSGLDPLMEQVFNREIDQVARDGATVLLSSHILSEVERTCDRVAIIREGRLVKVDRVEGLRDMAHHTVELVFAGAVPTEAFASLPGVSDVVAEDHVLRMRVSGPVAPVVKAAAGYDLSDFISREPTLEETFLAIYGPQGESPEAIGTTAGEVAR